VGVGVRVGGTRVEVRVKLRVEVDVPIIIYRLTNN
jgi:hypothetical protein